MPMHLNCQSSPSSSFRLYLYSIIMIVIIVVVMVLQSVFALRLLGDSMYSVCLHGISENRLAFGLHSRVPFCVPKFIHY